MGVEASRLQLRPALAPFVVWDSDRLDAFLAYVRRALGASLRLSKWKMLEFVGTERLEEVGALFAVFADEEQDSSCVNGLQLAAALVLCNHERSLKAKLQNCFALFDWNCHGSLSTADLAMMLRVCSVAVGRSCGCPPGRVPIRDLCANAIPRGRESQTCDALVNWAMGEEAISPLLQRLRSLVDDLQHSSSRAPSSQGGKAIVSAEDASASDEMETPLPAESGDTAAVGGDEVSDRVGGSPAEEYDTQGLENEAQRSAIADGGVDAAAAAETFGIGEAGGDGVDGESSQASDDVSGDKAAAEVDVDDEDGGAAEDMSSTQLGGQRPHTQGNVGEVIETFVSAASASIAERAKAVEQLPSPSVNDEIVSLEHTWKHSQGFLLPVAHGSGVSMAPAVGEAAPEYVDSAARGTSRSRASDDAVAVALRHRVWVRHACLREEVRFSAALAARQLAATPHPLTCKEACARAAGQIRALLDNYAGDANAADDAERSFQAALAQLRCSAEGRLVSALHDIDALAVSCDRPSSALRRALVQLDGATAFLDVLRLEGDGGGLADVEQMAASIRALTRDMTSDLSSTEADQPQLDTCILEFLAAQEVLKATSAANACKGDKRIALERCCEELVGVRGSSAGSSVDVCSISDVYEVAERRWRLCEGALAAQRSLARGGGLLLELWLCQARQHLRGCVRRSVLCKTLYSLGTDPAFPPPAAPSTSTSNPKKKKDDAAQSQVDAPSSGLPQTRRRVLAALHNELLRIRGQTTEGLALTPTRLQDVLPNISSAVTEAGCSPGSGQLVNQPDGPDSAGQQLVGEGSAAEVRVDSKEEPAHNAEGQGDAVAHLRNLKFEQRVHAAAVCVAQGLRSAGIQAELVDRLMQDLDQSSEVLTAVQQSAAFTQRTNHKWKRVVEEELKAMAASCDTLDAGIAHVRARLCGLHAALLELGGWSGGAAHPDMFTPTASGACLPMLSEGLPLLTSPTSSAFHGDVAGLSISRHAQLACSVGALVALELAREGAGSADVSASRFALMRSCCRLRAEARVLEALAEHRIAQSELAILSASGFEGAARVIDSPKKGGTTTVDPNEKEPNDGVLVVAERLVRECCRIDLAHLLNHCGEDANLAPRSDIISKLLADVEFGDELSKTEEVEEEGQPEPPPAVPAMSSWLRAEGGEPSAPFDGPCCQRCLALSELVCGGGAGANADDDNLRLHAVALRVWIFARAQRAVATTLLRGGTLRTLAIFHVKRTLSRFTELAWRQALKWQYLAESAEVRRTALRTTESFLAPLNPEDVELLQAEDIALHVSEVRGSLGAALSADLDGHLRGLAGSLHSTLEEPVIEEGREASATAMREAGLVSDSAAKAQLAKATASARDFSSQAEKFRSPGGQKSQMGAEPQIPYVAKLFGTLRGFDLLELACTFAHADRAT